MRNSLSIAFKVTKYFSIPRFRPFLGLFFAPPYDLKHLSPQILLKIVTTDEQKRNSPQILLKIVSGVCCSFGQIEYLCGSRLVKL
jgi:hypothetical protein